MTAPHPPARATHRAGTGRSGRPARTTRGTRRRRVTALVGRLTRRRAARDGWLLVAIAALVAVTALLAVGGPRLVTRALDEATAQTIADAGGRADLLVTATIQATDNVVVSTGVVSPDAFLGVATYAEPPEALAAVVDEVVVSVDLASALVLGRSGGEGAADAADGPRVLRIAMLAEGLVDDVRVVTGRLPGDSATEVVVPEAVAERFGLAVGSELELAGEVRTTIESDPETGESVEVELPPARVPVTVVGVVAPEDPASPVWRDLAYLWPDDAAPVALVAQGGATALAADLGSIGSGTVRAVLDPSAFSLARARAVLRALDEVQLDPVLLTSGVPGVRALESDLREVIEAHLAAVPAARAQISVPQTGVVGAAALVLVLVSRLLVRRRADAIGLERARGASVPAVTLRLLLESAVVVGVGTAAGVLAADALVPGSGGDTWLLGLVVAVALVVTPAQGALLARRAWTGRRVPANRRERERLARRRALRRVVAEVGVVLLALGAGWSLRGRGLIGGSGVSGDPFLAVAPLLMAVAMTVLALRLYPWPVRAFARLARPSRGVLGVLGAARAVRALEPLPLLALTVGVSVAVTGLLLIDTVRSGQVAASWERTGAEVRLEGADLGPALDDLRAAPGVTAVAAALTADASTIDLGAYSELASVLAIDEGYVDVLRQLPDPPGDVAALAELTSSSGEGFQVAGGRLPVVAEASFAAGIRGDEVRAALRGALVPMTVVATTEHAPRGQAPGPFLFLSLVQLDAFLEDGAQIDTVWVQGPGAVAAAQDAAAELELAPDAVQTRETWLTERRELGLVSGVERAMVVATAAVGVLAILALGATVLAGARERGRTLSLLRTLGMRARLGWWLALAELVPMVAAALLAGAASGVAVVGLLGGALGLDVLVGGVGVPAIVTSPAAIGWLGAGAVGLLLVAAFVEVAAHRRDRLSEVLRVGETTT